MAATPYNLRPRLNGQSPSSRSTPTGSPSTFRTGLSSPRKLQPPPISLQLRHVIGTTTTTPSGLAYCSTTNRYAYCAGSVAVLADVLPDGTTKKRYYRARPTATSLNPPVSHYGGHDSPSSTTSRRRTTLFAPSRQRDFETGLAVIRDGETGGSQTWTARERIKAISCVALSEDGKYLAIGESGYSPRVLLYLLTSDESLTEIPTSIVSDHAIGVKAVAFSPNGKYLATLGNLNDGYVYIWAIDSRNGQLSLVAANKCTTNVCGMTWCGSVLVTAGTRHVKIWTIGETNSTNPKRSSRPRASLMSESPSIGPATLSGRNALLGPLVDCTFTAVIAIDSTTILLTTDAGHLCIFRPHETADVQVLKVCDFEVSSIAWQASTKKVILGSRQGLLYESYAELIAAFEASRSGPPTARSTRRKFRSSAIRMSIGLQSGKSIGIAAVACLPEHSIALDTDGNLYMETISEESSRPAVFFASHSDLIQGVQRLPFGSSLGSFYTWSRRGELKFWDGEGKMLHNTIVEPSQLDQNSGNNPNELRVARHNGDQFILGDSFGIIQLFDNTSERVIWTGRAHGGEINDIAVHRPTSLVATCSRDRTVQVFRSKENELQLAQTLDDHIGAVTQVMFSETGERLLSCAADRTVIVRERAERNVSGLESVAYLSQRVVTLKSSPLSMSFTGQDSVIVSMNDRRLANLDLTAGMVTDSVKLTDPDNDDTVALSTIHFSSRGDCKGELMDLILACSPTDKSIRIYHGKKCTLVTREAGHTEGISDLCLLEDRDKDTGEVVRRLVSTGLDGTIMIWNVSPSAVPVSDTMFEQKSEQIAACDLDNTPSKPSPVTLPPLRKVLGKTEVLEFAQAAGLSSPGSPRSLSPPRLNRKQSQLAVSVVAGENMGPTPVVASNENKAIDIAAQSPVSPITAANPRLPRARDTAQSAENGRRRLRTESPSPRWAEPTSTPQHTPRTNNRKLRRPPSIPNDLRERPSTHRRQSMSQPHEFGSIGMATEQATRMLKTFRKKLAASKEDIGLEELELELELVLSIIKEKQSNTARKSKSLNGTLRKSKAVTTIQPAESDLNELVVLLDRANLADRTPRKNDVDECMKT